MHVFEKIPIRLSMKWHLPGSLLNKDLSALRTNMLVRIFFKVMLEVPAQSQWLSPLKPVVKQVTL